MVRIKDFITSLLHGYFVGTFLMLETPANKPMFPFRAVEGVEKVNPQVRLKDRGTAQLVLEGQQRITSLFYAFYQPDIPLKGAKNLYSFYLNLDEALNGDIDEAVEGVSQKKHKKIKEFDCLCKENKAISLTLLRDNKTFYNWLYQKESVWSDRERDKIMELYQSIQTFMIPVIYLPSETSNQDIVNIFERINRTGVGLSPLLSYSQTQCP